MAGDAVQVSVSSNLLIHLMAQPDSWLQAPLTWLSG
jgi:hypothetical protein